MNFVDLLNANPFEFTEEEQKSVNEYLEKLGRIAREETGQEMLVHPEVRKQMIALGLVFYGDELLLELQRNVAAQRDRINLVNKIITANVKAYKIYSIPILLFQIAGLMELINDKNTAAIYRQFLNCQRGYIPSELDMLFLNQIGADVAEVNEAIKTAQQKVGPLINY